MEENNVYRLSVRDLVEYSLKSGDICTGFLGVTRMVEGTMGHQRLQGQEDDNYSAEVPVSYAYERGSIALQISGRIDGILKDEHGVTIDEIKTTRREVAEIEEPLSSLHLAQAKCYGFIYGLQNNLDTLTIRLTYYNTESDCTKRLLYSYSLIELEEYFCSLADKLLSWLEMTCSWRSLRDKSIENMEFPYDTYREGQRSLAVGVYRSIMDSQQLFIQAPTGIGKTSGVIFPALKAMREGLTSRVFYATAKTITRTVALEALDRMRDKGLKLKTVVLTAKDKLCFKEETLCDSEYCEYARGYYDRIDEAVKDIYEEDSFTREKIEEYARKHRICPFEFSLDLALWADCIICDYNYVFDPRVSLKRFFSEKGDYTLLIDEGHNLVDRAREMYSAELMKKQVLELKRAIPKKDKRLYESVNKINSCMIALRKSCEEKGESYVVQKECCKELVTLLRGFIKLSDAELSKTGAMDYRDQLTDMYFQASSFIRVAELFDDRFVFYVEKLKNDLRVKLFCIDPSKLLKEAMDKVRSSIIFSATLSPMDYYASMLGGDEKTKRLILPSPFPKENLCLIVNDKRSTRYKEREDSIQSIAQDISTVVKSKRGNYLVFFPSYSYMEKGYESFSQISPEANTIVQSPDMDEKEKENFLRMFSEKEDITGFGVLGGMFSEGIDLTGDKLIGCIIIGVGLPMLCLERNLIKEYFQQKNSRGYEYSYVYPGMNKVLQAAGRVIRTEKDRGVVMLVDDRYSTRLYRGLFPKEWMPVDYNNNEEIHNITKDFWDRS